MFWAELIDFVVKFVSDPELLVVFGVVQDSLIHIIFFEFVHNFNFIEVDKCSVWCSAWNIRNYIGLDTDFHFDELFIERDSEMESWLSQSFLKDT